MWNIIPSKVHLKGFSHFERVTEKPKKRNWSWNPIFLFIYKLQFQFLCDQVLKWESFHIDFNHLILSICCCYTKHNIVCNWETKCYTRMRNQTLKVINKSLEFEHRPKVMESFYNSIRWCIMLHFPPNWFQLNCVMHFKSVNV